MYRTTASVIVNGCGKGSQSHLKLSVVSARVPVVGYAVDYNAYQHRKQSGDNVPPVWGQTAEREGQVMRLCHPQGWAIESGEIGRHAAPDAHARWAGRWQSACGG